MTIEEAKQWLFCHADHLDDTPYGASTGGRQCREIARLIAELEAQAAEPVEDSVKPLHILHDAFVESARHGEKLRWEDLEDGAFYLCVRSNCERISIQQFTPQHAYEWHCGNDYGCWLPYLKIGEPDAGYLDDDDEELTTPTPESQEGPQHEC